MLEQSWQRTDVEQAEDEEFIQEERRLHYQRYRTSLSYNNRSLVTAFHQNLCHPIEMASTTATETQSTIPDTQVLDAIAKYDVLDESGKAVPFGSLYTGEAAQRRQLIIFIRHYYCGVSPLHHAMPQC